LDDIYSKQNISKVMIRDVVVKGNDEDTTIKKMLIAIDE
jgi:hypothetical protein